MLHKLTSHEKLSAQIKSALTLQDGVKEHEPGHFTVPSRTEPGKFRHVYLRFEDGIPFGRCSCPGWSSMVRKHSKEDIVTACTHIVAALIAQNQLERLDAGAQGGRAEDSSSSSAASPPHSQMPQTPGEEQERDLPAPFRDLGFGVMIYRGKRYLKKEALIQGARRQYPDLRITSEVISHGDSALVKARVESASAGVCAEGLGSASPADTPISRLVEMAETRALNRAIRHLFGLPLTFEEIEGGEA